MILVMELETIPGVLDLYDTGEEVGTAASKTFSDKTNVGATMTSSSTSSSMFTGATSARGGGRGRGRGTKRKLLMTLDSVPVDAEIPLSQGKVKEVTKKSAAEILKAQDASLSYDELCEKRDLLEDKITSYAESSNLNPETKDTLVQSASQKLKHCMSVISSMEASKDDSMNLA